MTKRIDSNGNELAVGDIVMLFSEYFYRITDLLSQHDKAEIEVINLFTNKKEITWCGNFHLLTTEEYKENKSYLTNILNQLEKAYTLSKENNNE